MVSLNFDLLLNFCLKKMVSIIKGSKYYLSTTNSLFYRLLNSLLDRFCVFVYRTWFHSNRRFPFCHNYSLIIRLFVKLEYEKNSLFCFSTVFIFYHFANQARLWFRCFRTNCLYNIRLCLLFLDVKLFFLLLLIFV